ncbi:MAG: hypothetical protein ACK8QZ_04605, partial [Anaerolineales bacterium]
YEAMSRLRTEDGDIIPAGDFIDYAETFGLMPKIDNMLVFRCVQVTRRLQLSLGTDIAQADARPVTGQVTSQCLSLSRCA